MPGATSHKLGVRLMIFWENDVGGKKETVGKRVGYCHPDLSDQLKPGINSRLVPAKCLWMFPQM